MEWTDPEIDHQNGIITEYKIHYKLTSDSSWSEKTVSHPTDNTVITGLSHWLDYDIKIAASTSKGYGPDSSSVVIKTDEFSMFISNPYFIPITIIIICSLLE